MSLNQAQISALTTTLCLLDERADAIGVLLDGDTRPHALLRIAPDLSDDARQALREQIVQLRDELAQLATAYWLRAEPRSMWRGIDALLATSWTDLEDTRPAKLNRYGSVDPAVVAPLDTALDQLIARIDTMRRIGQFSAVDETHPTTITNQTPSDLLAR